MEKINALLGLAIILLAVGNVVAEENSTSMPVIDMYYINYNLADVTRQNCNESNYDKINGILSNLSNNMSWWGLDNVSNKTRQVIQLYVWLTQGLYGDTCTLQSNFYNLNKTLMENSAEKDRELEECYDMLQTSFDNFDSVYNDSMFWMNHVSEVRLENQKLKEEVGNQEFMIMILLATILIYLWLLVIKKNTGGGK